MEHDFITSCKRLNIKPIFVGTYVTPDVYNELEQIADEDDTTIEQFLRDMIDDYIECRGK